MNLLNAQGAINALKNKTTLEAAYTSYAAGHDGKHRESTAAYSYNWEGTTGNEAAGYYQVTTLVEDPKGPIIKEIKGWGPSPTIKTYSARQNDLAAADEKAMLLKAFNQKGGLYTHPNANRFHFATFIPPGYTGHLFRGGGKVYPKIATPTNVMVIVVSTGNVNLSLVTHFPEFMDVVKTMTLLT